MAFSITSCLTLLLATVTCFSSTARGFANRFGCVKSKPFIAQAVIKENVQVTTRVSLFRNNQQESNSKNAVVLELAAETVKIGPLRFLLQLQVVSQSQQLWLPQQGDDGDAGVLRLYFKDGTGMIAIELQPDSIRCIRHGENPSLQYQLQESVLIHSILDELQNAADGGEEEVEKEKRLLVLKHDGLIRDARSKLPARSEQA